jgi:hypothetical protein
MRRFTQDEKILAFIDIVEKQLGYQIPISTLTEYQFKRMPCGVQRRDGKWIFCYYPGESYTSSLLCHELLHIVLVIEGWPYILVHNYAHGSHDTTYITDIISSLFLHAEIW